MTPLRGRQDGGYQLDQPVYWLLSLGEASGKLQKIVAEFSEWMLNNRPPWDAYHMLMFGRP